MGGWVPQAQPDGWKEKIIKILMVSRFRFQISDSAPKALPSSQLAGSSRAQASGQRLQVDIGLRTPVILLAKRLRFARFFDHFACETLAFRKVFWRFWHAYFTEIKQKITKSQWNWEQNLETWNLKSGKLKSGIWKPTIFVFIFFF